tara:strand:- start:2002 stop:3024 length:1023 start_codon:yes stop_codon:yes gene_type:complete
MNKILQRPMFKQPQHEHRSTGIASGLKYREEYAVGGRVGFKDGTPEPDENILNVNPLFPSLGEIKEYEKMAKNLFPTLDTSALQEAKIDYTDPSLRVDYSKYGQMDPLGIAGSAAATTLEELSQPTPGRTLGKRSEVATFFKNLLRGTEEAKARKDELALLSEEQDKALALKEKEQDKEITLAEFDVQRASDAEKTAFTSGLINSGFEGNLALKVAEIQANTEPMKVKEINTLLENNPKMTFNEAMNTVYGTIDDQYDLLSNTIQTLLSQQSFTGEPLYTLDQAVEAAIKQMQVIFGDDFIVSAENLNSLTPKPGDPAPDPDPDPQGGGNINPEFGDIGG